MQPITKKIKEVINGRECERVYERVFSLSNKVTNRGESYWVWNKQKVLLSQLKDYQITIIKEALKNKPGMWFGYHSNGWLMELERLEQNKSIRKTISESALNKHIKVKSATDRFLINMPVNFPNCEFSNDIRKQFLAEKGVLI
jgi:hypothetical protein